MIANKLQIPPQQALWRRWLWPAGLAAGIAALIWLGLWSWQQLWQQQAKAAAVARVDLGPVLAEVSGYGRLLPRQNSSLIAEVDGTVTELLVYPGTEVKQSTALVLLRNPLLERERERAELALLEARAAKESTQAKQQREAIVLENEVALVRSEIALAEQEMKTLTVLLQQQILARLDYLRAETKLTQARMRLDVGQRNLVAFQQAQAADLRAADYRLQQADKLLKIAEHDIAQLAVKADRDGLLTMLASEIEIGKPVRKGDVLAQITDPASLYADIRVAANDAVRLSAGQSAQVVVQGQSINASVLRVYPVAEQNQVRVELTLTGQQPDNLRPNQDVAARITTEQRSQVMRVKPPLYITHSGKHPVFVADKDQYQRRIAEIGVVGRDYMEVQSGLQPGEQILLDVPTAMLQADAIKQEDIHGE